MVPPQSVLEDALAAARTIYLKAEEAPEENPGFVERLLQRQSTPAAPPAATLTVVPSNEGFVRVARLGNVTANDARILARALGQYAATWPAPVVHVAELAIELTDTQLVINAKLGGDTGGLRDIFDGFNAAAKAQRFFLDRRSFRPEFTVASVALPDDPSFLERLEWEAEAHRGHDWQVTNVSMLRATFGDNAPTFDEVETLALGLSPG